MPTPPVNLVGDFGGALYLALGIVAGILEARPSGKGQVVDAAIVETTAHLMTSMYGMLAAGMWSLERGTNLIDTGGVLLRLLRMRGRQAHLGGGDRAEILSRTARDSGDRSGKLPGADRQANAPREARDILARRFRTRTRDEWCAAFEGSDACVAPVLSMAEAPPPSAHAGARAPFVDIAGIVQPAPVPRFSRTVLDTPAPPPIGNDSPEVALAGWLSADEIAAWTA